MYKLIKKERNKLIAVNWVSNPAVPTLLRTACVMNVVLLGCC
jgi:hypothetical protein